ncbi:hypothetical protein BZM27_05810 [Paraburkholderia steynii]|uniref:Uncharacterized protein n=1 Tax=Paraburkholderia steynii TaxID=1245441 RepID=A0A4R0XFQ0_9BURK|nr:hypothetical protein BZM27_05810 [Paraburkholderia steynii]
MNGLNDLRHIDTRWALTDAERQEIRRSRQREALGLTEPRVAIGQSYVPPSIARQYQHIQFIRGAA